MAPFTSDKLDRIEDENEELESLKQAENKI
jgi:hypothetical protein